jgi:hypothetical protein
LKKQEKKFCSIFPAMGRLEESSGSLVSIAPGKSDTGT